MSEGFAGLRALAGRRARVAAGFTIAIIVIYFGFILLIAFAKPLLSRLVVPGLSLGILIGASVIVAAWLLTLAYVRWANRVYDPELARLRPRGDER
jgi:uncharacterized membrane protein (DUF485 family)